MSHRAGTFTILTQRLGYSPAAQSVNLTAGEAKEVNFALLRGLPSTTTSINCPLKNSAGIDTTSLNILRSFRDEVLESTAGGNRYIELYYQYSSELNRIIKQDASLKKQVQGCVARLLPLIKKMIQGEPLSLTSGEKTRVTDCLEKISNKAGTGLKLEIEKLMENIEQGLCL